jgi:hypothetical protein
VNARRLIGHGRTTKLQITPDGLRSRRSTREEVNLTEVRLWYRLERGTVEHHRKLNAVLAAPPLLCSTFLFCNSGPLKLAYPSECITHKTLDAARWPLTLHPTQAALEHRAAGHA